MFEGIEDWCAHPGWNYFLAAPRDRGPCVEATEVGLWE